MRRVLHYIVLHCHVTGKLHLLNRYIFIHTTHTTICSEWMCCNSIQGSTKVCGTQLTGLCATLYGIAQNM